MKSMDDMMTYVSKNKTAIGYYQLVLESFFGDICGEFANDDINAFQELLGEETLDILFPVMWEFFYTNIYGEDGDWNLLDKFLASPKSKKIPPKERAFLENARNSIFSVYKILSVDKDASFTVKDMIKDTSPMAIREKSLTHYIKKGDVLGLRVVDMQDHYEITGGALQLSDLGNTKIKAMIRNILAMHKAVMMIVQSEKGDTFNQIGKDLNHIAETMWSVMIAEEWMRNLLEKRRNILSTIKNRDGHLIQSVKLIFPITVSVDQKFHELLEKHKQIEADGDNSWVWLDRKSKKEKSATILGLLTIEDSCLVANLNSQQRANILEDMLQNHLKEKIGKPQQVFSKENSGSIEALMKSININSNHEIHDEDMISLEQQQEIIQEYKDAHYKKWISSRIPALGNKTPRMAKKTKEGKSLLIDLLIEMQESENEQAKINKQKAYDFSWIWEELNLEWSSPK